MADSATSLSLLERVRHRDPEAWKRLVFIYAPLIQHWCQRWGAHEADAEDVQQEVFQSVARKISAFRRDRPGDTFRGWLRVIAFRKFLDLRGRQQLQPKAEGGSDVQARLLQVPDPADADGDDTPEQVQNLHHRALELVRSQFESQTWRAFWRCAVEGDSPAEIAQDMAVTPAAVRKAKSRVLRRLKEEFGDLLG